MLDLPVLQPAIVVELQLLRNDKRHDSVAQALLEQQQTPNATVAVLKKRVDALKPIVKVQQVVERLFLLRVVGREQCFHRLEALSGGVVFPSFQ